MKNYIVQNTVQITFSRWMKLWRWFLNKNLTSPLDSARKTFSENNGFKPYLRRIETLYTTVYSASSVEFESLTTVREKCYGIIFNGRDDLRAVFFIIPFVASVVSGRRCDLFGRLLRHYEMWRSPETYNEWTNTRGWHACKYRHRNLEGGNFLPYSSFASRPKRSCKSITICICFPPAANYHSKVSM